jgi:hypothetical protein
MGLFDKNKKKGDDFDSPVERIDLSAPPLEPAPMAAAVPEPAMRRSPSGPTSAPTAPTRATPRPKVQRAPAPVEEVDIDEPDYGIDEAIELMRSLPTDNVELVVQVVKRTLESTRVKVSTIIDDATRKQARIESRIDVLKQQIAEFEQEISTRRREISSLETDHRETTTVKEQLVLAERITSGGQAKGQTGSASRSGLSSGPPDTPRRKGATTPPSPTSSDSSASATSKGTIIVGKK